MFWTNIKFMAGSSNIELMYIQLRSYKTLSIETKYYCDGFLYTSKYHKQW